MYPPSIQKLIDQFAKFPSIGQRTAARFVFYLIKLPKEELEKLLESIVEMKKKIKLCSFCFHAFENSEKELCQICSNPSRDRTLLCIVEKETDLLSLEKIQKYKGLYFVFGGTIDVLQKENNETLKTKELLERIKNPSKYIQGGISFQEIILAINPTTEGEATALYIERIIKPLNMKITRLGRGLPIGGELEYADEETLGSAFEGRK